MNNKNEEQNKKINKYFGKTVKYNSLKGYILKIEKIDDKNMVKIYFPKFDAIIVLDKNEILYLKDSIPKIDIPNEETELRGKIPGLEEKNLKEKKFKRGSKIEYKGKSVSVLESFKSIDGKIRLKVINELNEVILIEKKDYPIIGQEEENSLPPKYAIASNDKSSNPSGKNIEHRKGDRKEKNKSKNRKKRDLVIIYNFNSDSILDEFMKISEVPNNIKMLVENNPEAKQRLEVFMMGKGLIKKDKDNNIYLSEFEIIKELEIQSMKMEKAKEQKAKEQQTKEQQNKNSEYDESQNITMNFIPPKK